MFTVKVLINDEEISVLTQTFSTDADAAVNWAKAIQFFNGIEDRNYITRIVQIDPDGKETEIVLGKSL